MKILHAFIWCVGILFTSCDMYNRIEQSITKAVIYYHPNCAPWGLLKIVSISVEQFFEDRLQMDSLELRDLDSLDYIMNRIAVLKVDTLCLSHYVDTDFAVLLYSPNRIDTLGFTGYPDANIQYNRMICRDSILANYFLDIVRKHATVWDTAAKEYHYNGIYQSLPKNFWNNSRK